MIRRFTHTAMVLMKTLPIFLFLSLFLVSGPLSAKDQAMRLPPLPGEVIGQRIYFETGRVLDWPSQDLLVLRGPEGRVLASVDLLGKASKESGTEALGLEVEEADLGGSANSKKYLGGKKAPKGRRLDGAALAGKPTVDEAGQSKSATRQGIPITTLTYPNGAYLIKFQWPDFIEEVYFDRRKTMVYNQQTRRHGAFTVSLKQFGDGSFSRVYQGPRGELSYTYDANDKSYRFSFQNSQKESLLELNCQETCVSE